MYSSLKNKSESVVFTEKAAYRRGTQQKSSSSAALRALQTYRLHALGHMLCCLDNNGDDRCNTWPSYDENILKKRKLKTRLNYIKRTQCAETKRLSLQWWIVQKVSNCLQTTAQQLALVKQNITFYEDIISESLFQSAYLLCPNTAINQGWL